MEGCVIRTGKTCQCPRQGHWFDRLTIPLVLTSRWVMRGKPSWAVPDLVALINMLEIECWFVAGSSLKYMGTT